MHPTRSEGVLVNTAFLAKTGLKSPIDQIVVLHDVRRRILGVVENHVDNLFRSKEYEPFIFYPAAKNQYITLLVKTEAGDLAETQKYLETTWKEVFPTRPFESQFQEDLVLKGSRETNANLEKIFLFITVLGGLLSASGIFALASLNIAKRTKGNWHTKGTGSDNWKHRWTLKQRICNRTDHCCDCRISQRLFPHQRAAC